MTPVLQYFADKQKLNMSAEKYPFKLPRLAKPKDESLQKDWYCEYYVFDEIANSLKRKRIVLSEPTKADRLKSYKANAEVITKLLKSGAVTNPRKKKESLSKEIETKKAIDFFLTFSQETIKQATIKSYKTQINRLNEYLDENHLSTIKLQDFTEDIALSFADHLTTEKQISNRTRNNNINALITIFNFFKKRKLIQDNPFEKIEQLKTDIKAHTAFLPDQAQQFKQACQHDAQLWLFCQFIYYVFVRPREELRHLKISDISEKSIVINFSRAKNRRTEHIMIPAALEAIIQKEKIREYPPHYYVFGKNGIPSETPTYYHQLYRRHANILKKCGLIGKNIDMYSWKHTGVIALWNATQNIQLIREQCRHSDLGSTMKYLRDLGLFTDYDQINKFPEL